jgi:hypothetical protein
MMDWTKQAEEMAKDWTESQQKMWDEWLKIMQSTAPGQLAEVWQKTVETWEKMVKNTLASQGEWTTAWAESITGKSDLPEEVAEWAKQAQTMSKQWRETQEQLWAGWFDLVKKADPAKIATAWGGDGQKTFKSWQESAQKMMEAQMKWANLWTTGPAKEKK